MDEEENFAKLLSQSTSAAAPSWSSPATAEDPWSNPFSDTPTSNPFASPFGTSSAYVPAPISDPYTAPAAAPDSPRDEISPYVAKLEEEGIRPDMPSVIAAREQASLDAPSRSEPIIPPFVDPTAQDDREDSPEVTGRKGLPSDLIDEDLLAASDPSLSLKKAFVKSTPAASPAKKTGKKDETESAAKAYVFTPTKKAGKPDTTTVPATSTITDTADSATKGEQAEGDKPEGIQQEKSSQNRSAPTTGVDIDGDVTPTKAARSVPLPESNAATPTATRPTSPTPTNPTSAEDPAPSPAPSLASTIDRVAVSPLDPPPAESDYGFQSLSIGASSIAPPPPSKSPIKGTTGNGWSANQSTSPPASRFGGKGWGAMDEDDDGLFGKGGPSVNADPWVGGDTSSEGGWGEPGLPSLQNPIAGPSTTSESDHQNTPPPASSSPPLGRTNGTPRTPKVLSKPMFQINVGDPTRMGDPVRGYTVYTVRTRTTSPHYRKGEFSVLRRFSDFLWLFETLTMNNPGVIVPPVPDKHPFGRFQDTFIETRRLALERCLTKITAHPVLQLDPDLRLFLESDHFATDSKSRRAEHPQDGANAKSLLSSWTGPKFVEQDDWFDSRRTFLDSLESQLKALSKSIETASKTRLDLATGMGEFATSMSLLADSDLGSAMCAALARLSDLIHREKEANEEQAKAEVVHLLNLSDEYVRFIGSVRMAFASRIKCYEKWQAMEKEVGRLKSVREKARQQGKLGDRGPQSLAEIVEAERRSRDMNVEFDSVSKLVKSEFGRFERERVDEFKRILERYLDGMIVRQKELIEAWEEYHAVLLKMVGK